MQELHATTITHIAHTPHSYTYMYLVLFAEATLNCADGENDMFISVLGYSDIIVEFHFCPKPATPFQSKHCVNSLSWNGFFLPQSEFYVLSFVG